MSFSFRRSLTVDHTLCGSSDSTDFPVLVSVTDSTLATTAHGGNVQSSSGYDLNFYADSGATTLLNWELESYDPTTGTIIAWVKIPTVSHTSDTVFYLFYDDATISSFQGGSHGAAWNSNYLGVYHLGNGTTLDLTDSTANNATLVNTGGTATAGQVGGGIAFDGSSFALATLSSPTSFSLQCWATSSGSIGTPLSIGDAQSTDENAHIFQPGSIAVRYGMWGDNEIDISAGIDWSVYSLFTYSLSGTSLIGYVNGSQVGTATVGAYSGNGVIALGTFANGAGNSLVGTVDEVRVTNIALNPSWIMTDYNNQSSGSFVTLGSEAPLSTTNSQTQSAVARIQVTSSHTQAGLSRIRVTNLHTQSAIARLRTTSTKTQSGISRLQATSTQTQPGKSRVQVTSSATQTGITKIVVTGTSSATQSATARIQAVVSSTQSGISRIQVTTNHSQPATARVAVTRSSTQSGISRLRVTSSHTQNALSRLQATLSATQTGIASILSAGSAQATQTGTARIQATSTGSITGTARISSIAFVPVNRQVEIDSEPRLFEVSDEDRIVDVSSEERIFDGPLRIA